MRFASLNNSNARDYAAAGKAVADTAADSFTIMRRSGPDYAGLSKVAMNTRSAEKIAAMKASADLTTKGIEAVADVTETGMNAKAGMKLVRDKADRVKMAGKVAGIGAVLGGAVMAATDKDDDDKSWREKHYALQDELLKKQIARLDREDSDSYPKPPEASAPPESTAQVPGGSSRSTAQSTGGASQAPQTFGMNGSYSGGSLDPESAKAIRQTANNLQLDPYELGALIEMESSHRPNVWGGAGGKYRGLIQFGPGARKEVGLPDRDMTIAEQMPYVQRYFEQRGFKPGQHDITHAYRTVLVGNPHQSGTDSWGTNSDGAAKSMRPGGRLYELARKRYGTWTSNGN